MPITALSDEAPIYERPFVERTPIAGEPSYDKSKPVLASLENDIGVCRHGLTSLGLGTI